MLSLIYWKQSSFLGIVFSGRLYSLCTHIVHVFLHILAIIHEIAADHKKMHRPKEKLNSERTHRLFAECECDGKNKWKRKTSERQEFPYTAKFQRCAERRTIGGWSEKCTKCIQRRKKKRQRNEPIWNWPCLKQFSCIKCNDKSSLWLYVRSGNVLGVPLVSWDGTLAMPGARINCNWNSSVALHECSTIRSGNKKEAKKWGRAQKN